MRMEQKSEMYEIRQEATEYTEHEDGFTMKFRPAPEDTEQIKETILSSIEKGFIMEGLKKVNGRLQYTLTAKIAQEEE
jgi:hypothetical protein